MAEATGKPSYVLKFDRAEKHLDELETMLALFSARHPYHVARSLEGESQKETWRLVFTEDLDETMPVVLGDFINNLRAGLDHLAAALVKPSKRGDVSFPIVTEPIWEANFVKGDYSQRAQERKRWDALARELSSQPLALLKSLQPMKQAGDPPFLTPFLPVIRTLSNNDKHSKLLVVNHGLGYPCVITYRTSDGQYIDEVARNRTDPTRVALNNQAELKVPPGTVDVQIRGSVLVMVDVGEKRGYGIREHLRMMLGHVREIGANFAPYLYVTPTRAHS